MSGDAGQVGRGSPSPTPSQSSNAFSAANLQPRLPLATRIETVRKLTPSPMQLEGEFNLPRMLERMSSPALAQRSQSPAASESGRSEQSYIDGPSFEVDPKLNQPPELLYSKSVEGKEEGEKKDAKKVLERKGSVLVGGHLAHHAHGDYAVG